MTENSGDPLWYKDAIIYEVHVRAFSDSNGDGRGDFPGLTRKLDYIQDLGATAIWILPFYPSPWRDDGYDTSGYTEVHPTYGTLRDFQTFLREAHRRGLRVITELILNHTSDQHPWFQRARYAKPGSRQRNFYVWSDTPEKYQEARVIFKDFQSSNWTWDPVAKAYYWHRFYAHQPDLNFDHPLVRRAMFRVVDFWLEQGVDGFRLDAVPYLFEREGTNCEHLPETHAYLKELRAHIDSKFPDRVLLAEANVWPEDAIAYLGGDECQMAFHFPLMPRLFTANQMEDRFPIIDILRQTPAIPESCQWALFLRNHDELTLEMVTDEERDYMYRVYAHDPQTRINLGIRRRLAPLLGNDRRRIELMNALLLSLPGTPVIYYGDEIGMGDNVYLGDRDGVRTPMQWSSDRNAGFSHANPQQLYLPINIDPEYHYEAVNVEIQQNSSHSLLRWMKRLLAIRKQFQVFGRGTLQFLEPENHRVLVFCRMLGSQRVLVVANLSRFVQAVELDLSQFAGLTPIEMFGRAELSRIREALYPITLGPYAFYWLTLEDKRSSVEAIPVAPNTAPSVPLPVLSWTNRFDPQMQAALAGTIPAFLHTRRWFNSQNRRLESVSFPDIVPLRPAPAYILLTRVDYANGDAETYALFASVATGEAAARLQETVPEAIAAKLVTGDGNHGILYSAVWDKTFPTTLLDAVARRRRFKSEAGEVVAASFPNFRELGGADYPALVPVANPSEQTNNSFIFGDRFILKLFRRVEPGTHPELEIGRLLSEQSAFTGFASLAGRLEYQASGEQPMLLGLLHRYVPHEADAWQYTMDSLSRFFERTETRREQPDDTLFGARGKNPVALSAIDPPPAVSELTGEYLERARLLGQRTAELHLALAANGSDPDFTPEPLSDFYKQGFYHALLGMTTRVSQTHRLNSTLEESIRAHLRAFRDSKITGLRIRVHGNYNLRDVLYTGKDFVIIDFEGDPKRPLTQRRIKRPPLSDVASMLVSLHDAAHGARLGQAPGLTHRPENPAVSSRWAECWYLWVAAAFLKGYLKTIGAVPLLPVTWQDTAVLLNLFTLEKLLQQAEQSAARDPNTPVAPIHGLESLIENWPTG